MKDIIFTAETRETGSTSVLKQLRKTGMVPAMVYGKHSGNRAIKLLGNEVKRFDDYMAPGSNLNLQVGKEKILVIVKEVQRDSVLRDVVHIDFQELTLGEKIKVKIPIHLLNRELVEVGNMLLQQQLHEIEIETLPKHLIQSVDIDCKTLHGGGQITVGDLPVFSDENIEVAEAPETLVASLAVATRAAAETEGEEGGEEAEASSGETIE